MANGNLLPNWSFKRKLPEPFEDYTDDPIFKNVYSKHCIQPQKRSTLHAATLRAILAYLELESPTSGKPPEELGAIGSQGNNFTIAEYPSKTGELHVVAYNRINGKFTAGCYQTPPDPESNPEKYMLKEDEKSGAALIFALIPTAMADDEFNEHYQKLKDDRDNGYPNMDDTAETAAILCDNLYRRIRYGTSLPTGGIPNDTPGNGSISQMKAFTVQKGTYSPTDVILGAFQVLKPGTSTRKVMASVSKKDFVGKYILSESRTLTPQEELTVPQLPDWYIIPAEIKRICEHAKLTTNTVSPMRNFLLRGPAGTGKTEGAKAIASGLHLPYRCITCSANTEIFDLLGQILPDVDGRLSALQSEYPTFQDIMMDPATAYQKLTGTYDETVDEDAVYQKLVDTIFDEMHDHYAKQDSHQKFKYVDTPLVEAIRYGYLVELQEPTVIANPGVLVGLNSLLDRCNSVFLPNGDVINRHPDTTIVVTTNNDYAGCKQMNQSVISRMNLVIDLDEPATGRYRQGLQTLMEWDDSDGAGLAYTDNYKIHINAGNHITQSFPSRMLRSESLVGMNGHETAHLLFTDFTTLGLYLRSMENGSFYPEEPSFDDQYQESCEEMLEAVHEKDKAVCLTLSECASHISNILEDIYIEARMCDAYPGIFKQGIELNCLRMNELMPSLQSQIDNGFSDFSIVANLLLQYCRAGTVNNLHGYTGPYLDYLEDCVPFVEESIYSDDVKDRLHATNHILGILWEYIKPMVEDTREKLKAASEEDVKKLLSGILGGQIQGGTPLPSGKGGAMPKQAEAGKKAQSSNPPLQFSPQARQNIMSGVQDVVTEEGDRIQLAKTSTILEENNPGITYNHQYLGSGYEKSASDLFRILNSVATEKAEEQYQQEMTEELQKAANDIHYGNAHAGIHVTVNRMCSVPDDLVKAYQSVAPPLLRASKRLQKTIAPLLKEESEGGKLKNLQFGKRLDTRALHHEDGTFFTRTRLPSEEQKLAVGLLIDESGSMSSFDRITYARMTAIVLYDFCQSLQIPVTIYGHTTPDCEAGVALYSYAKFDSIDTSDRYRLMDMSARNGNRDGAALRYVAEHLSKRPENQKLLIIISDGQPADYGYSGTEAEADLRGIKKEYSKKGIVLFAAAIGSDKENIKRIYQDGFLDITKLEELPKNMALLVKQYLK